MSSNVLTYIIEVQDKISGKLKTITIANEQQLGAWADVEKKINSANRSMKNMGGSIGSLREKIDALRTQREWIPASNTAAIRATNHEIERLEKQITKLESLDGGRLKKWSGEITSSIPALVNPLSMIGVGIAKSVSVGMENELQKQNITSLLAGDVEAADTLFNQISEYGKKTVYDKAGLIEAQKTMMSFGLSSEKSFSTLKQIGDIAMGDANKMQSLALAFSQVTSAGKLQGQDLNQLINAGFNPLQIISEKTGKSMSVLKDEMGKGQISAEMVAQAFTWATEEGGLFYQGAEKAGQTLSGRMNQLKDSIDEMLIALFGAIEPILSPLVDFATNVIGIIGNGISNFINGLKEGEGVAVAFGIILGSLAAGLVALKVQTLALMAVQKIKTAIDVVSTLTTLGWKGAMDALNLSFLACPLFWIIAAVVALIGTIVWLCSKITGLGTLWKGIVGFMKYTFLAFVDAIRLYFTTYINGFLIGLDKIRLGWYKFKEAVGMGDSEENQNAINAINESIEARKKAISDGAQSVQDNLVKAKESLGGIEMGWKKKEDVSEASDKVSSGLGINEQLQNSVNGNSTTGNGTGTGGELAGSSNAIASGGTRNTNVTINLGKMADVTFNGSVGENAEDMVRTLEECLLRVLYMAQNA